jgi:SAM-dependent methyltransferase
VSIDRSAGSLAQTPALANVEYRQADIFALPFADAAFDHVFVCFVLEHLDDPVGALRHLQRVLKPGGTMTVIEGDHGSAYFHPDDAAAREAIQALVDLQSGDANIGRRLYPLLVDAGLDEVRVSPRMVYVDPSRPELVTGFTLNTFTAMIAGVREAAVAAELISAERFDAGIAALERTAAGTFCYTFFKATAVRA